MKSVFVLTDYLGHFGSKYNASPYRSGLDKNKLASFFNQMGVEIHFLKYSDLRLRDPEIRSTIYIHDSIEDTDYFYKSYIEDIVYSLELLGAVVIPGYKFLRAHNNKVFLELLRDISTSDLLKNLNTMHFGSKSEFNFNKIRMKLPVVIKGSENAQGRQVFLGKNKIELDKNISKVSRTRNYFSEFKDLLRSFKHKDYVRESKFRKKFILQEYINGLTNDWKVLIFYDIYYILRRGVPKGDFKASGSKYNYGYGSESTPPDGIFDFAFSVKNNFSTPYISIDIAWDGRQFFALEYQFVSFGSSTHLKSNCYYKKNGDIWQPIYEVLDLEYLYAYSICSYLKSTTNL